MTPILTAIYAPIINCCYFQHGYRTYKSNTKFCKSCLLLENCTLSTKYQKIVNRHVWANLMDELEHQCHTALNKEIYKNRKQTIEGIFADSKEKHGMCWTKYRGLEKVVTHTMLTFAAINLKKLAINYLFLFCKKKKKCKNFFLYIQDIINNKK